MARFRDRRPPVRTRKEKDAAADAWRKSHLTTCEKQHDPARGAVPSIRMLAGFNDDSGETMGAPSSYWRVVECRGCGAFWDSRAPEGASDAAQ